MKKILQIILTLIPITLVLGLAFYLITAPRQERHSPISVELNAQYQAWCESNKGFWHAYDPDMYWALESGFAYCTLPNADTKVFNK